jgi:hypothetical protein
MSAYKTAGCMALGAVLVAFAGFALTTEVRAGDEQPPVQVDQAAIAQASAFAGEYTFVGGQKEKDGIDAAIETSVAALAPMLQSLGRKRLQESNPVPKQLYITVRGDAVEIAFDSDRHSAALDGRPVKATSAHGDKVKVTHRMRGAKLTEQIQGDKGGRHNTLKLSEDGQRLTVDVEISSSHLPVPVSYRLTFKRK